MILAGRSVNCRYGPENRRAILESRVSSTRVVGQAIASAKKPPRVWLQASTATIYAHRYDAPNDEATGILGGDEPDAPTPGASASTSRGPGSELEEAVVPGTRKVHAAVGHDDEPGSRRHFDVLLSLVRHG